MDWTYNNNKVWKRVYEYLDKHDTPDHRFIDVTFSEGLGMIPNTALPSGCFYPTIKLIFSVGKYGMKTEQWFW